MPVLMRGALNEHGLGAPPAAGRASVPAAMKPPAATGLLVTSVPGKAFSAGADIRNL
jgi:hypothetical protein